MGYFSSFTYYSYYFRRIYTLIRRFQSLLICRGLSQKHHDNADWTVPDLVTSLSKLGTALMCLYQLNSS